MPLPNPPLTRTERSRRVSERDRGMVCRNGARSAKGAWSKRGKIVRYDVNDLVAFLANGRQACKREESRAVTVYVR